MIDLNTAKADDKIIFDRCGSRYESRYEMLDIVERVTASLVICSRNRFRKSDGKMVGEDYIYGRIATDEEILRVRESISYEKRITAARTTLKNLTVNRDNIAAIERMLAEIAK